MRWYVLIHQVPPRPPYLRAKVGRHLARIGALPVKNSVYLLPHKPDCLEDFQWVAQEIEAGGGEAIVFEAEFTRAAEEDAAVRRFRAARRTDYETLQREIRSLGAGPAEAGKIEAMVTKLRGRLEEIRAIDFFDAPGSKEAQRMIRRIEEKFKGRKDQNSGQASGPRRDLVGRTWVTRRGVKVDRIATAWLVRRFLDPRARFRYVDPRTAPRRGRELRFDMVDGDFTHEADRCTFETLMHRAGIRDGAVRKIAEIVHDIDLKDGKYGRPETSGVQRLIEGLVSRHDKDSERVARGGELLDDLYRAFDEKRHS